MIVHVFLEAEGSSHAVLVYGKAQSPMMYYPQADDGIHGDLFLETEWTERLLESWLKDNGMIAIGQL